MGEPLGRFGTPETAPAPFGAVPPFENELTTPSFPSRGPGVYSTSPWSEPPVASYGLNCRSARGLGQSCQGDIGGDSLADSHGPSRPRNGTAPFRVSIAASSGRAPAANRQRATAAHATIAPSHCPSWARARTLLIQRVRPQPPELQQLATIHASSCHPLLESAGFDARLCRSSRHSCSVPLPSSVRIDGSDNGGKLQFRSAESGIWRVRVRIRRDSGPKKA